MAENTKIQWATHTFNPWRGCTKIAPGCANCYADAQSKRNPGTLGVWGPNGTRVVASEAMWREPMKWNAAALSREALHARHPEIEPYARPRVFCASLADVFEDWRLPVVNSRGDQFFVHADGSMNCEPHGRQANLDDVRARLFRTIDSTPNLDWLLLTKRPENVRRMVHDAWTAKVDGHVSQNDGDGRRWRRRDNVWLGTSIACQEDADRNVPELLKCRDLAAKLFLSIEPLVDAVNLNRRVCVDNGTSAKFIDALSGKYSYNGRDQFGAPTIDWVIVGGESGPHARPCDVAWVRSIVRQCRDAGVPCFVKQLGAMPIGRDGETSIIGAKEHPFGNGAWRRLLDPKGGDPAEWPKDVRVREVPTAKGEVA